MNRSILIVVIVVVILLLGSLIVRGRQAANSTATPEPTETMELLETPSDEITASPAGDSNPATSPSATDKASPSTQSSTINIQDFSFAPASMTVKSGQKITVTNKDSVAHTLTSDDKTSFDTGSIAKNQSATFTAPTKPGTYTYHCIPHPEMTGTLIVS